MRRKRDAAGVCALAVGATVLLLLLAVLVGQTLTMAPLLPSVVAELGPLELVEFSAHFAALAMYTVLARLASSSPADVDGEQGAGGVTREDFLRACQRDAWLYGSGLDQ